MNFLIVLRYLQKLRRIPDVYFAKVLHVVGVLEINGELLLSRPRSAILLGLLLDNTVAGAAFTEVIYMLGSATRGSSRCCSRRHFPGVLPDTPTDDVDKGGVGGGTLSSPGSSGVRVAVLIPTGDRGVPGTSAGLFDDRHQRLELSPAAL